MSHTLHIEACRFSDKIPCTQTCFIYTNFADDFLCLVLFTLARWKRVDLFFSSSHYLCGACDCFLSLSIVFLTDARTWYAIVVIQYWLKLEKNTAIFSNIYICQLTSIHNSIICLCNHQKLRYFLTLGTNSGSIGTFFIKLLTPLDISSHCIQIYHFNFVDLSPSRVPMQKWYIC